jgi:trehalose-phosphatase
MLDVDGTLAPIVDRFDTATVPSATQRTIAALVAKPGVHVALVSGRGAGVARRMVGVDNVWVAGNHGFEVQGPDGGPIAHPEEEAYRASIATALADLEPRVRDLKGVIIEDKALTLSVHYRLADDSVVPALRSAVETVARPLGLRITNGKRIFEVRPPAAIDKGTAVLALAERLASGVAEASMLFAGDDVSDEDAIIALRKKHPEAVTVRIMGADPVDTAAEFSLRDTDDVRRFLEELVRVRSETAKGA